MNALAVSAVVFACVFGGALVGFWLRTVLPDGHLSPASRDLVKLGMGTIATMTALVLGLLVASAKNSYDSESRGLTAMAAKVILLDRILAHYGPEAQESRDLLKVVIAGTIERIWPKRGSHPQELERTGSRADLLYDKLEQLVPKNDVQRGLQSRALSIATDIAQTRLLMIEEDEMQSDATHVAQRRGAFELNCPAATATILSKEMIQTPITNPRWAPPERAEYTVGVSGCDKRATYLVVCAAGGTGCVAGGARSEIQGGK